MLRSIGKQSGESVESVLKKKRKATVIRICHEADHDAGIWLGSAATAALAK